MCSGKRINKPKTIGVQKGLHICPLNLYFFSVAFQFFWAIQGSNLTDKTMRTPLFKTRCKTINFSTNVKLIYTTFFPVNIIFHGIRINDNFPAGSRGTWEVSGSSPGPHHVILETLKGYLLLLCLARDTYNESWGNALSHKQA